MQQQQQQTETQSWLWYFVGLPWRVVGSFLPLFGSASTVSFPTEFESRYGNVHPNWSSTSFQQLASQAKTQFKFIFVYLHSSLNENSDQFCREVLCSEVIQEICDTNFLCWGGNVNLESEPFKISQILNATGYPFVAVLCNNAGGGLTILDKIEGAVSLGDLVGRLAYVVESHGPELLAQRLESEELVLNRQLREEQDVAFQQSLLEDQEKERRAQEEAQAAEAAKEVAAREEQLKLLQQQNKLNRKKILQSKIGVEPAANTPDVSQLLIRLPDGSRLQRRFKVSQTLQDVFDYIESQCETLDFSNADADDNSNNNNNNNSNGYELVTQFPRQSYSDTSRTLLQLQLFPQASLFLQEKL